MVIRKDVKKGGLMGRLLGEKSIVVSNIIKDVLKEKSICNRYHDLKERIDMPRFYYIKKKLDTIYEILKIILISYAIFAFIDISLELRTLLKKVNNGELVEKLIKENEYFYE